MVRKIKKIPEEYRFIIEKAKSLGEFKTKQQKQRLYRLIEASIKLKTAMNALTEPSDKNIEIHLHLHVNNGKNNVKGKRKKNKNPFRQNYS